MSKLNALREKYTLINTNISIVRNEDELSSVINANDDIAERKKNRFGRQVGGGRGSEYSCSCGLSSCDDKTIVYSSNLLSKCRQCQSYLLTTHLSTYWTCRKCLIERSTDVDIVRSI